MRRSLGILAAVGLVLLWTGSAEPGEDKEARSILDKAIQATGGETVLAKHNAAKFKEKGTYHGMGQGFPYTGNYAVQWPDQFRMEIADAFILVVNGDKGWLKAGGETMDMSKEQMTTRQNDLRVSWISTLLPLKDKAFMLKALGEVKVDDRPTLVIKVTRKDYPEVKLYFDKTTNLLIKSEFKTTLAEDQFKETNAENYFSDFKEFDGLKVPTKMVFKRDGKLYVEAELVEYKAAGKLDDKVFARP
jgi:hypothetical protein